MNFFKILILGILLTTSTIYADTFKVVYDLTTGDIKKIDKGLINGVKSLGNYYTKEKQELEIIVVISGNAYKYFIKDLDKSPYAGDEDTLNIQKSLRLSLEYLTKEFGVTFNMCAKGMHARNIKKTTLYKYVNAEKMKSVYLIEAQNNGYAYMPIH